MIKISITEKIHAAINTIQKKKPFKPKIGIILGSGLGSISKIITDTFFLPYTEIPHFQKPQVEGHQGQFILGKIQEIPVVVLQGRFHYYEGHSMQDVVFPTRVLCALGIHTLILTNAAGGINPHFSPGELMLIEDHLNLLGENPLRGPHHLSHFGPRFPDLSEAYCKNLRSLFLKISKEKKIPLRTGIYAAVPGPNYETPAEIRMLRTMGADAVGMSTVPETIAARHFNAAIKIAGISCITNLAAGLSAKPLSHKEVIENSEKAADQVKQLILSTLPHLNQ